MYKKRENTQARSLLFGSKNQFFYVDNGQHNDYFLWTLDLASILGSKFPNKHDEMV